MLFRVCLMKWSMCAREHTRQAVCAHVFAHMPTRVQGMCMCVEGGGHLTKLSIDYHQEVSVFIINVGESPIKHLIAVSQELGQRDAA